MKKNVLGQVVILLLLTIIMLFVLSLLPPLKCNNFTTKKIDLLSDIRNKSQSQEDIDEYFPHNTPNTTSIIVADTDSCEHKNSVDKDVANLASTQHPSQQASHTVQQQSSINQNDYAPQKAGDTTLIEDYSPQKNGLAHLINAIKNRHNIGRPVRIGFLGDSFIEADILTQNIRELLQDQYGGCGVGYMAMHSDFPGFRRSITQIDKGWNTHNVVTDTEIELTSLPLQLHRPNKNAVTQFRGVSKLRHIDRWNVSTIALYARETTSIKLKTDSSSYSYNIKPQEQAQFIKLYEPTSSLEIRCDSTTDVAFWGAWLDDIKGIAVDNISMRGYSGNSIELLPQQNIKVLNDTIPYDLIVLQYGLNRMTASILHYEPFTKELVRMVNHLRSVMPHTDILILGIGDRCQNENGELQTMPAVYALLKAQRKAAIESQCLFWNTCEAMKSLGGMPQFVENKWANKDYTHINHAGGNPLGKEFIKALNYAIEHSTDSPQ